MLYAYEFYQIQVKVAQCTINQVATMTAFITFIRLDKAELCLYGSRIIRNSAAEKITSILG